MDDRSNKGTSTNSLYRTLRDPYRGIHSEDEVRSALYQRVRVKLGSL